MKRIFVFLGFMFCINLPVFAEDVCFVITGENKQFSLEQPDVSKREYILSKVIKTNKNKNARKFKKFIPIAFKKLTVEEKNSPAIIEIYGVQDGELYINSDFPGPGIQAIIIDIDGLNMKFISGHSVTKAGKTHAKWCM